MTGSVRRAVIPIFRDWMFSSQVTSTQHRTIFSGTQTIPTWRRHGPRPNRNPSPYHRKERAWKELKVELPDYEFDRRRAKDQVTPEELKEKMKKAGIQPPTPYMERPVYISSMGAVIDEYVPPEGDGKASLVSTEKVGQVTDKVKGKGKSMMSVRKIRKYEDDFDPKVWVEEAQETYIAAHRALADKDEDALHKYATEKAFPEMMNMTKRKTVRWNFIKSLEPPRVVHVRHAEVFDKENIFGQLTVRFHTQQTLAVYDRFGRLIHGGENVAKDVLEYVVFEKHLANVYGTWRLHAKIIPDWMPPKEPGRLTFLVQKEKTEAEEKKPSKEEHEEDKENEESESIYDRFGRVLRRKQ